MADNCHSFELLIIKLMSKTPVIIAIYFYYNEIRIPNLGTKYCGKNSIKNLQIFILVRIDVRSREKV